MLAGSFLLAAASAPSSLTVDLDGDGRPETVEASVRAGRVRFTARGASGKRIAAAQAPAPRDAAAAVALRAGSLGSAGAMLEVLAASDREECRTLWRVRGGKLQRLPLRSPEGAIPDCGAAGQWTSRFDRPSENAPAVYLREQSKETPQGLHHVTQVFRFSGFGLDREQVRAEIRGVSIPQWYDGTLYPRTSIEALAELFDFDPVRQLPRLTISASPSRGEFVLRFREPGGTRELAVRSQDVGGDGGITLRADGNGLSATATVKLARDVPYEVLVTGLPERYEHLYSPASRLAQEGLQVFPNAEAQLASDVLPGGWVSDKGERVLIEPVSEALGRVRIGEETFALDVLRAPPGTDLLLIGRDATSALDLRGRHAFTRRPARCGENSSEDSPCVAAGPPGEVFRRIGARVNVR